MPPAPKRVRISDSFFDGSSKEKAVHLDCDDDVMNDVLGPLNIQNALFALVGEVPYVLREVLTLLLKTPVRTRADYVKSEGKAAPFLGDPCALYRIAHTCAFLRNFILREFPCAFFVLTRYSIKESGRLRRHLLNLVKTMVAAPHDPVYLSNALLGLHLWWSNSDISIPLEAAVALFSKERGVRTHDCQVIRFLTKSDLEAFIEHASVNDNIAQAIRNASKYFIQEIARYRGDDLRLFTKWFNVLSNKQFMDSGRWLNITRAVIGCSDFRFLKSVMENHAEKFDVGTIDEAWYVGIPRHSRRFLLKKYPELEMADLTSHNVEAIENTESISKLRRIRAILDEASGDEE